MADILTPTLGESVSEATIAKWSKKAGEAVKKDEVLVELETDKVSLEVVSPSDGVLAEIKFDEGDTVTPGAVLGSVTEGAADAKPAKAAAPAPEASAPLLPPLLLYRLPPTQARLPTRLRRPMQPSRPRSSAS